MFLAAKPPPFVDPFVLTVVAFLLVFIPIFLY
jgi:hypothetical protein